MTLYTEVWEIYHEIIKPFSLRNLERGREEANIIQLVTASGGGWVQEEDMSMEA